MVTRKRLNWSCVENRITNALRGTANAWHFYHALVYVIKLLCVKLVVRCLPLKRALWRKVKNGYYR
ncbi:hypothetical protein F6B84_18215 [Vibrio cholerae]|nr:hypothetical protein [Vibrio cholerae]